MGPEASNEQQIFQFLQGLEISNQPFEKPDYLAYMNGYQPALLLPQHSYPPTTFVVDTETTTAATVATYPLAGSPMTDMQVTCTFSNKPSGSSLAAFRPSAYELGSGFEEAPKTPTFKNSHYNTAHYLNSNFQPEA